MLEAAVEQALMRGEPYCIEVEFLGQNEHSGWLELRGERMTDALGVVTGLRGTAMDITERHNNQFSELERRVDEKVRDERARLLRSVSQDIRTALNGVLAARTF